MRVPLYPTLSLGGFSVGAVSLTRSVMGRSMLPGNGALGLDEGNSIFEGGIGQWAVELFWFALLTKIIHTHTHTRNINKQRKQTFVHIRI